MISNILFKQLFGMREVRKPWVLVSLILALLFICGCNSSENLKSDKIEYEAKVKPSESTLKIIEKVDEAFNKIDPEKVGYALNNRRAAQIKKKLDEMEPGKQRNLVLYDYAVELSRAGDLDKSIDIFQNFYKFYEENPVPNQDLALKEFKTHLAIIYLRKAELENCINNHNNESCIIPISEKAQHINKEGSLKAIEYLKDLLARSPFDYEMQYLLNIAYMTLGGYPDDVPEEFLIPESYFNQNNFPKFHDVAMDLGVDVNELSGGICVDDFNNDGYLDLMVSSWGYNNQIRYFENDQKGGFTDKTSYTGLVGVTGGLNLKHADYNNDGFLDFIILRGAWLENYGDIPNSLIRNNGDGTFTDVTEEVGLFSPRPTQTAIWADFNLDGWIDIFIANESTPNGTNRCQLFVNNGKGTFTDVAEEAGISETGFFKGVASGDVNNDGYQDMYISNFDGKNLLYINTSAEGSLSFELASDSVGVSNPIQSFSTWMFDYNNDGFEDIFVSGYSNKEISPVNMLMANINNYEHHRLIERRPKLYKNNGNGTFTNVSVEVGLNEPVTTMGCNFGDLDNDGFLDFYLATGDPSFMSIVPNKMYLNKAGEKFEDVTFSGGFGHIQKGHAVGFGDLDMDGDQDIYAVMGGAYEGDNFQNVLFENPMGNENNWINIVLVGTESNRSAIGARIEVTIEEDGKERTIYHTVGTGASFGGNSLMAEIGVGKANSIEQLKIQWPNRERSISTFSKVAINRIIKVIEGKKDIEVLKLMSHSFAKGEHQHH